MKGISFNIDGIKIKEDTNLYHDRVERLIYMSGVLGRPDWVSPVNDNFFRNVLDVDQIDDLLNDVLLLLESEPNLNISGVSAEASTIDQEKSGLKIKIDFLKDENDIKDNQNLENGFTFFSIYEA